MISCSGIARGAVSSAKSIPDRYPLDGWGGTVANYFSEKISKWKKVVFPAGIL